MGTRWQTERGGWSWGRPEHRGGGGRRMERSFVSLCGEMSRAKGAYLHMYVGAWTELNMYICIKPFFCPLGHRDTSLLLPMASLRNNGSPCDVSHISVWVCSHLHFLRRVRLQLQPWEVCWGCWPGWQISPVSTWVISSAESQCQRE